MTPLTPDPRQAKIQALGQYQTYCVIPIFVLAVLPHQHALDAQHARNSALFRLAVSVLGLVIMAALQVKKNRLKKAMAADAARQNGQVMPGVWPPPPGS